MEVYAERKSLKLRAKPWHSIASILTALAAPALFVFQDLRSGIILLVLGILSAWYADRGGCEGACFVPLPKNLPLVDRPASMLKDISLVAVGLLIIRTISLEANLSNKAMILFTLALGGAVLVPYLVSRFIYKDRAINFAWRSDKKWSRAQWIWLFSVIFLAWLILPWYFISSGVYNNWPAISSVDEIVRLFIGVGAVGIWDELFFIAIVFVVFLRHLPPWLANVLQATVFVSFLWELGYREWGPALTIPFALVQGFIFLRTKSLGYVVIVHLIFDAIVFAVLVHAHNPLLFNFFLFRL